jgi:WD40 repeat protein
VSAPVKTRRLAPRWDARTADYVTALAWSPDGRQLAAATGAGTLELFSAEGAPASKRQAHSLGIECLAWIEEGLFTGGQDNRLCRWDEASPAPLSERKDPKHWVHRLAWSNHPVQSPGGRRQPLLAAACGKTILLCDAHGTVLKEISHGTHTVEDACWFPNGSILLTAAYGGLQAWNPADGTHLRSYEWPAALWSCTWSPDGRWLSAGSQENAVHIWDAHDGTHMHMPGYEGKVRHQAWSPDSRWLATAGGMDVILWDCSGAGPEGRQGKLCDAHADAIAALAFHPRANHLATACIGGRLILWNADGEDEILAAAVFDEPLTCLAWSPADDHPLAASTACGAIAVF